MSFAFEWPELTNEDIGRSDTYVQDRKRQELESSSGDYESYLRSLQMRIVIESTTAEELRRICQLTLKTNQFNLRTKRYSEDDFIRMINSRDYDVMHVRLGDRFSNYGIIASVVLRYSENIAFIENWVMSCRVFKRGVEDATLNAIVTAALAHGARWLAAEYIRSAKNSYVANLLDRLCLLKWEPRPELPILPDYICEGKPYVRVLSDMSPKAHFIELAAAVG